jgi:DNA-binding MarR family transcriptional regulator
VAPRPDPLETSLLFDVFAVNQSVSRLLGEAMRGGPLSPAEYATYSAIFELEAATPTALAERLGMRLTTFIDQLRVIEGRRHARRVPHQTDGRSYRVVLTADGLAAHRAANVLFDEAAARFEAELGGNGVPAGRMLGELRRAADVARVGAVSRPRRADPVG